MLYLTNAFSINMLPPTDTGQEKTVYFLKISPARAKSLVAQSDCVGEFVSAIGHADMARVVGEMIGRPGLEVNRIGATFNPGVDVLVVAQYRGPRLPEGATELPEGATIEFWEVF